MVVNYPFSPNAMQFVLSIATSLRTIIKRYISSLNFYIPVWQCSCALLDKVLFQQNFIPTFQKVLSSRSRASILFLSELISN